MTRIEQACLRSFEEYQEMLNDGVSKELARVVLPVGTYTEVFWQMDLRNLFNFLKLRMDGHAQWEAQEYARAISEIVKERVPVAYAAFEKYILHRGEGK